MSRYNNSKNPFQDEDSDDFKFGNRNHSSAGNRINDTFGTRDEEDTLKRIQERIGQTENESLER